MKPPFLVDQEYSLLATRLASTKLQLCTSQILIRNDIFPTPQVLRRACRAPSGPTAARAVRAEAISDLQFKIALSVLRMT
jgi:hypothetical protein